MSGDRLIPDLANDPPPERDDDRRPDDRPRPERPPTPWDRPPEGSRPPPPPPPPPPSTPPPAPPTGQLPPPPAPQPFQQPQQQQEPYPYVHADRVDDEHERERETTPYASRFQLILGALLGIAAVAIVAALLVGAGPKATPAPKWSGWHPNSSSRSDAAQQIANHVAPTYRLDKGGQLVAVTGGDVQVADLPARLAFSDPSSGNISVLGGKGSLYVLCGLGPKCGINSGTPSPERHLLLRREALELALYTFRYVKNTDYVVALLPPTKATKTQPSVSNAVFFTRGDLSRQLDQPLTRTLPSPPPTTSSLNATDITTLEALTSKRLFQFKFEQGQDASVFLVLSPLAG